ncbi:MAG: cupin domain-containing protein [Bryobacteraceae bacterium]
MPNAQAVKDWLKLTPNSQEGGFLANVYQSPITIPDNELRNFPSTKTPRSICGAIYYFLEWPGCSVMHRVTGDMLYHFYAGDPVQMLLLPPEDSPARAEVCIFGNNLALRQNPMKAIPGGTWLGSRLMLGGSWALMGVSMAPGFDPVDYSIGKRDELIKKYPEQADLIRQLTRD